MLRSVRFILRHPLARRNTSAALWRYVRFHVRHAVLRAPAVYPWLTRLRVLADRGLDFGAVVGNLYTGLADFEEMGFLLHFLREGDLFVDIGANVGMYTLLAPGICGAATMAAEPSPRNWNLLMVHLYMNALSSRVEVHQVALGAAPTRLPFRDNMGTWSKIVSEAELHGGLKEEFIEVRVTTANLLVGERKPAVLKIDVEGYEPQVLRGASRTLQSPTLKGIIIEMLDCDRGKQSHEMLLRAGFHPACYNPFSRSLTLLDTFREDQLNTLYVRDVAAVRQRVLAGPTMKILGVCL